MEPSTLKRALRAGVLGIGAKVGLLGAGLLIGNPWVGYSQWPQWRGVSRDGEVSAPLHIGDWPVKPTLLWEVDIGGGYSGPVAAGDRVWVHSRVGEKEMVSSLRLSSGTVVWNRSYDAPFRQDDDASQHGQGPYATPSLAGGRLITFGVTAILTAWDAETGNLVWRRESAKEFNPSFPYFGAAASPLVWGDLCFVHLGGHPRGRMDRPGAGAIVALNVSDGSEKWRWSGDDPAAGASPVICEIEGRPQLVFKTKQNMISFDPRSGKVLWQIPYKVSQDNTIVTPLFLQNQLLTSDYDAGISAWRIQSQGESWTVRQLWKHREASLFTNSPVLAGGLLVGFSHFRKGQLFVLDPLSGEMLWRGEPRSGEHASLITWGNVVLVFLEDASLVVGEVSRSGFRFLRKYRLGNSGTWAHPALANNRIITRSGTRLAVYRLDER